MFKDQLRLFNCPNGKRINTMNALAEARLGDESLNSATIAVIATMDNAPDSSIVRTILDVEAIADNDKNIGVTVRTAAGIACRKCLGPVTDRSNGKTFCGRFVPEDTIERNRML